MLLKKEETLFERDEKGNFIPQMVEVTLLRKTKLEKISKEKIIVKKIVEKDTEILLREALLLDMEAKEGGKIIIIEDKVIDIPNSAPEIQAIPMSRGEWKRIVAESINGITTRDSDKEVILKNCVNPKFTDNEVDAMKTYYVSAIVTAIMSISGLKKNEEKNAEINLIKN